MSKTLPRNILELFRPHKVEKVEKKAKDKWPTKPDPLVLRKPEKDYDIYKPVFTDEYKVVSPKKVMTAGGFRYWSYWYQHPWLGVNGKIRKDAE